MVRCGTGIRCGAQKFNVGVFCFLRVGWATRTWTLLFVMLLARIKIDQVIPEIDDGGVWRFWISYSPIVSGFRSWKEKVLFNLVQCFKFWVPFY